VTTLFLVSGPVKFKLLKRLSPSLVHFIEPNFGLLEELLKCEVLNDGELQVVRTKNAVLQRNEQLLNCLKHKSQAQRQLFMEALHRTGQAHVANWIDRHRSKLVDF